MVKNKERVKHIKKEGVIGKIKLLIKCVKLDKIGKKIVSLIINSEYKKISHD